MNDSSDPFLKNRHESGSGNGMRSEVQVIQQQQQQQQKQHSLEYLNRSQKIKCYAHIISSKHVKQNQIRTSDCLLVRITPPVIVTPYWYQRWYIQLLLGTALMCSIIPTVMYRYHILALHPHHYYQYWWSYSHIETIRHTPKVSTSVSVSVSYRRYVHRQHQRIRNYLYNRCYQYFHTNTLSMFPIHITTNTVPIIPTVRPPTTRIKTTTVRHFSTSDDDNDLIPTTSTTGKSTNPSDDHTISTVSMIDWNQLVYDAYIEMETDGIQQLGNIFVDHDIDTGSSDNYNNIGNNHQMMHGHSTTVIPKNPVQYLSPDELWKISQETAQQIALFNKNNKVIKKKSKMNSNSDENVNIPWTGIAASMLNGWIAACSCSSGSSGNINHDMNVSSFNVSDYREERATYAEELFRIATTGQNVHKQMSSKKKLTVTNNNNNTLVTPDLVTYSLLYNIMKPINVEQAEYYLQLAQHQSKKIAGTQRRKLLSKLSTSSSSRPTITKSMFRDFESTLQNLLFPETISDIMNDVLHPDSNSTRYNLILYENENYMVINKPSGVCCYHTHVTTAGKRNIDLSIVDVLQKVRTVPNVTLSTLNPAALGIVHRLDRGTSGCLIIAKNDATHADIVSRLFQRQIQKTYTVLVSPAPCIELYNTTGYITLPVHGKPAKSKYTILERFVRNSTSTRTTKNGKNGINTAILSKVETAALMNITTYTGRQHQVRVHCSYGLGTPIIGDTVYTATTKTTNTIKGTKTGKNDHPYPTATKREQFHLHASSISFLDTTVNDSNIHNSTCTSTTTSPSAQHCNTLLEFDAPIPNWWFPVLKEWRKGNITL
jgi:23S rRNA-/tRNA-specific pseudouridylate synthase